jgi:hypothetical protein
MKSSAVAAVTSLIACLASATILLAQEPTPDAPELNEQEWLHKLGDQTWDFRQLATTYKPLKGELDPATNRAVWTFELMRNLTPGEVAVHAATPGSPFKPVLLDEEKVALKGNVRVRLGENSGKAGDAVRATFQLPMPDDLAKVKLIRVEKRTEIGF